MYYSNGFDSAYEELITFYPAFYRDVFEMQAILKAGGKIIDKAIATINNVIENSFVESADETTITRLEAWLHLQTDRGSPLEERRQLVYSSFVGFGKLSASKLKDILRVFTNADSKIYFKPTDSIGNNTLIIEIERGRSNINYIDIKSVLEKKIPAHIAVKLIIIYNQNSILKRFTHRALKAYTHHDLRNEVLTNGN